MKQLLTTLVCIGASFVPFAQQPVTAEDYARAEKYLVWNTRSMVDFDNVSPNWQGDNNFWYTRNSANGIEFILVNAKEGKRVAAFDQQKLATALSAATGKTYSALKLPFRSLKFSDDQKSVYFSAEGKQWKFSPGKNELIQDLNSTPKEYSATSLEVLSPDKTKVAYIKDYNLWVKNVASGERKQLTTDGIKDYGYATDNAGWTHSDAAILRWSPDSKKIATFRQDERNVGNMYLVTTNVGHPVLQSWKYPLPGDSVVAMIERVIVNVEEPKVIRLQIPPDFHRGTLSDDISSSGTLDDVDWSADGSQLAFISSSRDHKRAQVRIANAVTGEVREVFEENVLTQYESGQGSINFRFLPATNEIVWYSERDDYGHLYLYDSRTGKVKNQITKGNYVVTRLLKVDEKKRVAYFEAGGMDALNPYFSHIYSIGLDGNHLMDLTPELGNHRGSFSPDGEYFVDMYSQPVTPAVMNLRNIKGKLVTSLETTDISRLRAMGWKPPTALKLIANDGKTDLYGLMFLPSHLDPSKKYPVIDYIYPGPQGGSVGSWSFNAARGDHQALSELGFIVVVLEGSSNPLRSKSFHDMTYGNMAENTLSDQVAGIRQLAKVYPFMDTSRVGIWGHSGGGFATAAAMFRYPDFFKVGISESGNHDNRNYEDDWGERYIGLLQKGANNTDNYANQANQYSAKNLKGKLMLAHGMLDDNVPPYNTLLVVEALEKANKDFDLVIFPNSRHGYGQYSTYMMRRRWDYFVENLMGTTHPKEYKFTIPDMRN
ncbi:MAG: DPP IV N-terminal domain-containing protein [Ferruginibacter sp.]